MSTSLFVQNIIAVIWDFDKTLIPGYMQTPLVARRTDKLSRTPAFKGGVVTLERTQDTSV